MSVKRYDMKEVFKGRMAVVETSAGAFVTHGDYSVIEQKLTDMAVQLANAESKCRELAAECAGLKEMCEDRRAFIMNGVQLGYIKVPTVETDPALETIRIAVSPQSPTPATDTFLAEVRAQGVEMLISHLNEWMSGMDFTSDKRFEHSEFTQACTDFSAQLRKGAAL